MLVLQRRTGESIVINGNITVTVLKVTPSGNVRLGVTAPADVEVDRQEVHDKKEAEKQA